MELTVKKEDLVKGLALCQSVVERRTSMPILSNVLLEASEDRLVITATDLEISFQGSCAARVSEGGGITVPARKFYEIVKELPGGDIYLKEKENHYLHLTSGRANFHLVGKEADDFPTPPEVDGMGELALAGDMLLEMIEKTIFSISQEETRFNLAGLYVEKRSKDGEAFLRFVSTDGHRLSLVDRSLEGLEGLKLESGVIIPRKAVTEMKKMAEEEDMLTLGLNQNFAMLKRADAHLILRMQEGSFPDYEVVIPKKVQRQVVLNRQAFSEVLKRISIMATDRFQGVQLDFSENLLEVASNNPELGDASEKLEVNYGGEAMKVGFNARYFLDLCSAMRSEEITLGFIDEQQPCIITGEADQGFLSVIMPMRL